MCRTAQTIERVRPFHKIAGLVGSRIGAVVRKLPADAADLEKIAARVLAQVRSKQGQRLEEIGRALKTDTAVLKRPVAMLIAAKSLKTRGRKRGTMLLCGIALAGANLREDTLGRAPGPLTAEEIATLDLSQCELAVLSACDTNVGIRRAGQGVASLQKALQMAGARSVITSLWKVPDEATKDLMLDFYRRLWVEKKPEWQALWEAKMKIRNEKEESGKPKYSTRDWAAWVLTGDPN